MQWLEVLLVVSTMSNVSHEPRVASADQILDAKAQLDGLLLEMRARSAGGKAASGRYKRHDTTRLSYVNSVALPGLRWGKLPPEADWRMLFLPGDDDIKGADKASCPLPSHDPLSPLACAAAARDRMVRV